MIGFELDPLVEVAAQPAVLGALPVHWMRCPGLLAPLPAFGVPEFPPAIPLIICKFGKFGLGHRCTGDFKGGDFHRVGPFFIVEDKGFIPGGAEHKSATRNRDIARQRATSIES